jgi:dephospho-CoA kinase
MQILLAGPAGSGKDAAAKLLAATWGLTVHHLATPLYALVESPAGQAALDHVGRGDPARRADARRRLLQGMGDAFRQLSPTLLCDLLIARAAADDVVVADVRLVEEVRALRQRWPQAVLVYCTAPAEVRARRLGQRDGTALTLAAEAHVTETRVSVLKSLVDVDWDNGGAWADTAPRLLHQVADAVKVAVPTR